MTTQVGQKKPPPKVLKTAMLPDRAVSISIVRAESGPEAVAAVTTDDAPGLEPAAQAVRIDGQVWLVVNCDTFEDPA
jgi:hypothetical protein